MTFYKVDPTQFNIETPNTQKSKAIFNQMIENSTTNGFLGGVYKINFEGQEQFFILTHNILIRPRKNDASQKRIEIIQPKFFAEGGGSKGVHESLGVLIPENDFQFKEKSYYKSRVCKYIDTDSVISPSIITLEATHTQYNKKLHCKNAILDEDYGYLVMRRMREDNLYDLLEQIADGEIELTIEQRLQITYAILIAYRKRVQVVGLVHGDIKSENILVDWIKCKATIIDYGFARPVFAEERNDFCYGSFGFIAPEVLNGGLHTQESDLYALAMAIAELWGDTSIDDAEEKSLEKIEIHLKFALNRTWDNLFTGIKIDKELRLEILAVLKNLSHFKPSERMLDKAIEDWKILQDKYLSMTQKETNPHLFFNTPIISEKETSSEKATNSQAYQGV